MHAARASSRRITKAYHVGFHLIIFSLASWPRRLVGVRDRFANQLIGYYRVNTTSSLPWPSLHCPDEHAAAQH
jgi:hypothetical protein